jgi:hypothetical protein
MGSISRILILSAGVTSLVVGKEYSKRNATLMYEQAYKGAVSRDEISAAIADRAENAPDAKYIGPVSNE